VNKLSVFFLCTGLAVVFALSCSRESEVGSYDDFQKEGRLEKHVRKEYAGFFKALDRIAALEAESAGTEADSILFGKASKETDRVIGDMRDFSSTLRSRFAYDALSLGAGDLSVSPAFGREDVAFFWEHALLEPMIFMGRQYRRAESTNESALLQIVRSLRGGMGDKATGNMLMDLIPVVGPVPPQSVLDLCGADSLLFKKIFDLIVFSRSLQKIGPPLWMTTGAWFLALECGNMPFAFFALEPVVIEKSLYLTFRDYDHATVYSTVFDDPLPSDPEKEDAWLTRASAVMNNLVIDDEIADRITKSPLPTHDLHNFYNDYLLYTSADSLKKEFTISLKRDRAQDDQFSVTGMDSIAVMFDAARITDRESLVTRLAATRQLGTSMRAGRLIPGRKSEGTGYLIPIGVHSMDLFNKIKNESMPNIKVNTN